MLARPWQSVAAGHTPSGSARIVADLIAGLGAADPEEGVRAAVVGLPRRLSGEDTDQTAPAREFGRHLAVLAGIPVDYQDERLTSVEAESRLAVREKDWRKRKAQIDAAAAAIILQDYLDRG
jgi:putative Holliday junction resolvase